MGCDFRAMSDADSSEAARELAGGRGGFETTQWSLVLDAAGEQDSVKARTALETLCRNYWHPLFTYLRRRGCPGPDAQDLVQGFFAESQPAA